jgi:hypothetical protein
MKHERSFHILKILAFLLHQKCHWQGRWQLWVTVENEKYIWQAQWFICSILQPKWTFSNWQITVLFKDTVIFKQYIPKKHTKGLGSKCINSVILRAAHTIQLCILARQETCWSFNDCYSCNCNWIYCKAWKCGTQIIHRQFISTSSITWQVTCRLLSLDTKALWDC